MAVSNNNQQQWHHTNADTNELLQRELDDAHRTIRMLMRRLAEEQEQQRKTHHAYEQMKQNIIEINREQAMVERERNMWRMRAEQQGMISSDNLPVLTGDEINAIRRAMARIHHPDRGGDIDRMKLWNKLLDTLEKPRGN